MVIQRIDLSSSLLLFIFLLFLFVLLTILMLVFIFFLVFFFIFVFLFFLLGLPLFTLFFCFLGFLICLFLSQGFLKRSEFVIFIQHQHFPLQIFTYGGSFAFSVCRLEPSTVIQRIDLSCTLRHCYPM